LNQLKGVLIKSSDPLFKIDASVAIGSADSAVVAKAALAIATSTRVAATDSLTILYVLSAQPAARDLITEYARTHLASLLNVFPGPARPLIVKLSEGYCQPEDAAKVEAFFRPKLSMLGGGELELAQTTEQIAVCSALKTAKGTEIEAALANGAGESD
jgi:alanyl aminopeptidase